MILGLGTDLVAIDRLSRLLEGPLSRRFLARVFTENERSYCEAHTAARAHHYAGRFAAKEALAKALGTPEGLRWRDMEIVSDGPPSFRTFGAAAGALRKKGVGTIHLTLSHDGGMALATVILEGEVACGS